MKAKRFLSLLLATLLLLTGLAACSEEKVHVETNSDDQVNADEQGAVGSAGSIEEAKAALEAGEYEKAYGMLINNQSAEAKQLLSKLVFVPVTYEWTSRSQEGWSRYTYDDKGNILSAEGAENDNAPGKIVYQYDAKGHLSSSTSTGEMGRTVIYTCDDMGRVISEGSKQTYTYDTQGNILSETYTYSEGSFRTYSYTYDTYGHVLSCTYDYDGSDEAGVTTYTYDEKGRLVTERSDTSYINHDITYTYDAHDRLIKKVDLATAIAPYVEFTTQTITYEYIYEENGDKTTLTKKRNGKIDEVITYTQDAYGNYLTVNRETESAVCVYTWELYYYPNGVPLMIKEMGVQNQINDIFEFWH